MNNFSAEERQLILQVTDEAIRFGLEHHQLLSLNLNDYPKKLVINGASFVTLTIDKNLRGCIGTLIAYQPLIKDIAQNAYRAAFNDPRFDPLAATEYPFVTKHISILSPPSKISFTSEDELLTKIRPGIDGLILSERNYRGTFLPTVWESLPTPQLFWRHLKLKAGLPEDYWSESLQVERYTAEIIE
jgi:AmmeMemoRadiSam system protein A